MKKAILAISFGTSHLEQLEKSIRGVVKKIEATYMDYDVLLAFSSGMIIKKLKCEHELTILHVEEALEKLRQEGYEQVIVQPLHLLSGKEYDKVMVLCEQYKSYYEMKIGKPLLYHAEDYQSIVEALKEKYDTGERLLVFMGHGTSHEADESYLTLSYELRKQKVLGVVSTLQRMEEDVEMIMEVAKDYHKTQITIIPFMLVAGMHVMSDIMGLDRKSWQGALAYRGLDVGVVTNGLGEEEIIQEIFNRHIKEAEMLS